MPFSLEVRKYTRLVVKGYGTLLRSLRYRGSNRCGGPLLIHVEHGVGPGGQILVVMLADLLSVCPGDLLLERFVEDMVQESFLGRLVDENVRSLCHPSKRCDRIINL